MLSSVSMTDPSMKAAQQDTIIIGNASISTTASRNELLSPQSFLCASLCCELGFWCADLQLDEPQFACSCEEELLLVSLSVNESSLSVAPFDELDMSSVI